ncbi:Probable 18S rRNA (guanine-N(7))-methyltransferase [Aduncisulcus paluster]|uniref:Probable 18S rRNA (Guanine-N(7))-methyltransferase n=1 Tax=Aduncisulcus paluster TaxID=2918883 RepID=A0ABQ5K7J8_9EUKA|nr:Probable 18S rRNA (guanine-N(7))-methyltransferase [Aduncisulcus paluster]
MKRPEESGPPNLFYKGEEAKKYARNPHIRVVQHHLAERALELLALPERTCMLLDIGCGSGLSGEVIDAAGHMWVGVDISKDMLRIAKEREDPAPVKGDLMKLDIGTGVPFSTGVFDGAISISAVQWLCYSNATSEVPFQRLKRFFLSLYKSLTMGGRAVLQVYPKDNEQLEMMMAAARNAGFTGGVVTDYPSSTKARKTYLCLFAGVASHAVKLPEPKLSVEGQVEMHTERQTGRTGKRRSSGSSMAPEKGSKEWKFQKKKRQREQGREVTSDSKYSGRKRKSFRW